MAPPLRYRITFEAFAAAILVVYKHDANIQRAGGEGREPRFSFGKSKDAK